MSSPPKKSHVLNSDLETDVWKKKTIWKQCDVLLPQKKVHTATHETGEQIEKRRKATVAVERSPQAVTRGRGLGLGARST
jgi:hypothetical protein